MISSHVQAADSKDLKALTAGRGSLGRNLGVASIIALFIGLGLFVLSHSYWLSTALPLVFFLSSAYSNVIFFQNVKRIKGSPEGAVEVFEVEATHVLDIEAQGSNGPALAFLTESGECLLLVGQWLMEQKRFPSRRLRVYRWCSDGEPIRTQSMGPKEKAVHSTVALNKTHQVVPVQRFKARLESLQNDIDLALIARDV